MNLYKLKYKPLGSIAALIEWPKHIEPEILRNISLFGNKIKMDLGEYVLETVPAYNSLSVFFDTTKIKYSGMVEKLKELYETKDQKIIPGYQLWEIPVCYETEFALDLHEMAKSLKISEKTLIEKHSSVIYDVYFIGFLPGFLYLGGMDQALSFPRKKVPRPKIMAGDVGIAGNQTGIYPRQSPGGWNIIGNTPVKLFNIEEFPPSFAVAGDKLKFVSVDAAQHEAIKKAVDEGSYQIKSSTYE